MIEKDGRLIESFRKRRDEYRIPLRKESWEKLERELLRHSAFRRRIYRRMSVAAAILVCLALSLPFIIKKDMPGIADNMPGDRTKKTAPHKENGSPALEQQTIVAVASTSVSFPVNRKIPDKTAPPVLHELPAAEEETVIEEEETEKPEIDPFTGPQQEKRTNINYAPPANKNKRQSKWVFGLSAGSNNPRNSPLEQTGKGPEISNPGIVAPPYTVPDDNISIGVDLGSEGENEEEEEGEKPAGKAYASPQTRSRREITGYNYRHRPPISIGISVQKKLGNHFGLESGLTYTYLYSGISEKKVSGYTGNQTLHYLGIPLKANWLLYNKERFSIYLSGGALFEYCIAANRKTGNQKDELDLNRFQASLHAAAGMQLALMKPLSVFVEPGVSYFTDNGSGVETIRTDNPLMFNLQAGIRFTY
ncbi:MAG: PorT family protein [Tannerellaceae bacterium]|jgi:hypothetical protein|nr:PorT family protein [Tannerellaceae bacterium]